MTLTQLYHLLESQIYYDPEGRKFSFMNNAIHIDRRSIIPFLIYKENDLFYLRAETAIVSEQDLRIEAVHPGNESIEFYGKNTNEKLLTLSVNR